MLRATVLVLATTTLAAGCLSTDYVGRDPRKAYQTMQDGQRGYTRGGVFHSDFFGGGLEEVVQGNPAAQRAAETFHDRMIGGFIATMVGAVCVPVAFTYALTRGDVANGDGTSSSASTTTPALIALGCLALMAGGSIALVTAPPYQLDALNIYNDGVDSLGGWQPPTFAPPPPAAPAPAPMAPPPQY